MTIMTAFSTAASDLIVHSARWVVAVTGFAFLSGCGGAGSASPAAPDRDISEWAGNIVLLTGKGIEVNAFPGSGTVLVAGENGVVEDLAIGDPGQVAPVLVGDALVVFDSEKVYRFAPGSERSFNHDTDSEGWEGAFTDPTGATMAVYNAGFVGAGEDYMSQVLLLDASEEIRSTTVPYFSHGSVQCAGSVWIIGEAGDHASSAVVQVSWDGSYEVAFEEPMQGRQYDSDALCHGESLYWLELDAQENRVLVAWDTQTSQVLRTPLLNDSLDQKGFPVLSWVGEADGAMNYVSGDGAVHRLDLATADTKVISELDVDEGDTLIFPTISPDGSLFVLLIHQSREETRLVQLDPDGPIANSVTLPGIAEHIADTGQVPRTFFILPAKP